MPATSNPFTTIINSLGDPAALTKLAGAEPTPRLRVNSHIHLPPNFSAFETTAQAVELAADQDVRVLGVSNYYDYLVYGEFTSQARKKGIFPLFGIEIITLIDNLVQAGIKINDPGNPGKMYICGKGIAHFDPMTETARLLLQTIRDNDSERMSAVTAKLEEVFAANGIPTGLDAEAVKELIVARHGSPRETIYLQERHVAQAFQEVFFDRVAEGERIPVLERIFGAKPKAKDDDAVGIQNEIRSHLIKAGKPAFVPETFVDFDHACRLILALGGIPCYPTLADGATPLCPYEENIAALIADLKARRIPCAEFIPIRNSPEVLARYVHAMRDAGLFVTAGTEHNTLDLLPLEPTCLGGVPIQEDLKEIFWEGACVVAAHQYLTLRGEGGFVDAEGNPNSNYATEEERITAFRQLGAAVIAEYGKMSAGAGG